MNPTPEDPNGLREAVADILMRELIVRRDYDSVGRAADWIDGKEVAVDRILSGPFATLRADLERVTAERDEAKSRNGKLAVALHDEKMKRAMPPSALFARVQAAEAENTRLRALLVDAGEALRPFSNSAQSLAAFPPAGLVDGNLYVACKHEGEGKGWRFLPIRALVSDLLRARPTIAALDKAPTPKEPA